MASCALFSMERSVNGTETARAFMTAPIASFGFRVTVESLLHLNWTQVWFVRAQKARWSKWRKQRKTMGSRQLNSGGSAYIMEFHVEILPNSLAYQLGWPTNSPNADSDITVRIKIGSM